MANEEGSQPALPAGGCGLARRKVRLYDVAERPAAGDVEITLRAMIAREAITGVILAGGRGSRMGGVDKGLQNHLGLPMAMHALLRLAPQVGEVMINANRNLSAYESMGVPVWPDIVPDYAGRWPAS